MQKNNFGVIDDFMQLNIFQNILCVNFGLHLVNKKTEALVDASNENGLEVNADKTQDMAMSQDQTTR